MNTSLGELFTPLSREYCDWFYYLSVIGFVFLTLIVVMTLMMVITTPAKEKPAYMGLFVIMLTYAIFYFQNRLLYSMCVKSL